MLNSKISKVKKRDGKREDEYKGREVKVSFTGKIVGRGKYLRVRKKRDKEGDKRDKKEWERFS